MAKRLLTFLLLAAILLPANLLASSIHLCAAMKGDRGMAMEDREASSSCCSSLFDQSRKTNQSNPQLSHECRVVVDVAERQAVTTSSKSGLDVPVPADFLVAFVVSLFEPDNLFRFSPVISSLYPQGSREPVFLRNCSFLI